MSSLARPPAPFRDLIEESADEAAFLWGRWEQELTSLTRTLDEVWIWTEDRLHGALDGASVGGDAVDLAAEALRSDDPDRITIGTCIAAAIDDPSAARVLGEALRAARGPALRAMVRGLERLGTDQALRTAARVLAEMEAPGAGALCRLKAFRRVAPGAELAAAFASDLPDVRADALRAARLAPAHAARAMLDAALRDGPGAMRYAAVESALCHDMGAAQALAAAIGRAPDAEAGPYLTLLALVSTPADHETIYAALRVPPLQRAAVWALGHLGTTRAVEACLAGMRHEPLARACGEAYAWITGADLVRDRLALDMPSPDAPDFDDDDLDADLVPPADARWPPPDPEAAAQHWASLHARWTPGVRYVLGRPASTEARLDALEIGPMIRRADLALELRVATRGRYDVETRAFAAQQRRMMASGRAAVVEGTG